MSIEIKKLSYVYMPKTPFETKALDDVTLTIEEGAFTAIAGHTGSGKSTLIQHFCGLLSPTAGNVCIDGVEINGKSAAAKAACHLVGIVFQYPEDQLFEETVEKDIAFGPKNQGLDEKEITARVKMAMDFVGLDYETYHDKSPFKLSGGEMRRAAIAGILALKPKYLVLDEPTAGLDPAGHDDILARISEFHRKRKLTVILVSHDMDAIAKVADRIIVLKEGKITLDAPPALAFGDRAAIEAAGLSLPRLVDFLEKLKANGFPLPKELGKIRTIDEAVNAIMLARGKKQC